MMISRVLRISLAAGGCWLLGEQPATAQLVDHTAIGLTDLLNRYGAGAPDGSSVTIWQTEASPDLSGSTAAGTILNPGQYIYFSGAAVSPHATSVGDVWFGPAGISKAVPYVYQMSADLLVGLGGLRAVSSLPPEIPSLTLPGTGQPIPPPQVMNASWIGRITAASPGYTIDEISNDVLRRLDYLVDQQGLTAVVGVDNTPNTPAPFLGQAYNSIAVGLSSGSAARGYSDTDGAGRMVIDLVAPADATSWATPAVAGAATLLVDQANKTPALADAADPRVVRSLLMTGARKLPGWQRGDPGAADDLVRPLDLVQGAGELQVNNSYDILMAGEKAVGSHSVGRGWSLTSIAAGGVQYYYVDNLGPGTDLKVTLNWNRSVEPTPDQRGLLADGAFANLDLEVYQSDAFDTIGALLGQSASELDNVEHLFLPGLAGGRYAIAVRAEDEATYALSFELIPEATGAWAVLPFAGLAGWMSRRRMRKGS